MQTCMLHPHSVVFLLVSSTSSTSSSASPSSFSCVSGLMEAVGGGESSPPLICHSINFVKAPSGWALSSS